MKRFDEREEEAVLEVLRRDPTCVSGFYKNPLGGPSVQTFEEALCKMHGVKYAVSCSNGTSALHLALMALNLKPTEQVITTPLTFSASATSILMARGEPVFADVGVHYNINPFAVEKCITEMTKAIMPVHLLGMPCEMDRLMTLSHGKGIPIIEDAAQAIGAKYRGKLVGTFGIASTFSFQETKMISSGGEGGAVLTDNDILASRMRLLRNHGSQYGNHDQVCWNYRMTELQAAIGLVQLKKLPEMNRQNVENCKILEEAIDKECLMLATRPPLPDGAPIESTHYIYGCTIDDMSFPRAKFLEAMNLAGLNRNLPGWSIGPGYTRTIMDLPVLQAYKRPCPVAEDLVKRFLWFDTLRWKSEEEAKDIVHRIVDAYKLVTT